MFAQMQEAKIEPNATTFTMVLVACGKIGALHTGEKIHKQIKYLQIESLVVEASLISMYAKCGKLAIAQEMFDKALCSYGELDISVWNAMLAAYAQHYRGNEALQLLERLKANHIVPTSITFVVVLGACAHSRLVDEAVAVFNSMEAWQVQPDISHQNCMVDVYARAGHFEKAKEFALSISSPDIITWKTLLGACKSFKQLELGEWAAEQALLIEPYDAAVFVMLASLYGSTGMVDKQAEVWGKMEQLGIHKIPGLAYVELSGMIHQFYMDDNKHPQLEQIKTRLKQERSAIEKIGYVGDSSCVLRRDIPEEEKLDQLWLHSEKLAVGLALISLPPNSDVVIYKNLRSCEDCHTAIKLISKINNFNIILRDANRFHHMEHGECSCNDWW